MMSGHIIILSNDETAYQKISNLIKESGLVESSELFWFRSIQDLKKNKMDLDAEIIIADLDHLSWFGVNTVSDISISVFYTSLIFIKESISLEQAVDLMKAGASDLILTKDIKEKLVSSCLKVRNEKIEIEKKLKISDLKRDVEEILNNHIINSLPGIFFVIDKSGQIISINDKVREEFDYQEGRNNHFTHFVAEKDVKFAFESFEKTIQLDSNEIEITLKNKEGRNVPFLLSGVITSVGNEKVLIGTGINIEDQKKSEKKLLDEQAFTNKALDSLPGLFYVLDEDLNYKRVNKAFVEVLGYSREEIDMMNPLDFYQEEDHERIAKAIEEAFVSGSATITSRLKTKNGELPYFLLTGSHFKQNGKNYILGTGVNVTERVIAEEKMKESLREKEVLLMEIHHRVKNNLALVSGLMQLQAYQSEDENIYKYLSDNQSRIKSIALIHEQLYENHNFSSINLAENTKTLVNHIKDSVNDHEEITLDFSLDEVEVNINQAIPYSLALNELVTNAFKHAFELEQPGILQIGLSYEDGFISLKVKDDGKGLPDGYDIENPMSLGFKLLQTLKDQLNGDIRASTNGEGTIFELTFKKEDDVKGAASSLSRL